MTLTGFELAETNGRAVPPDLRAALSLADSAGQLLRIKEPTNLVGCVATVYAPYAGLPAPPPTSPGPVVLIETPVAPGAPGRKLGPLTMGMYGTRERCAMLMGTTAEQLSWKLLDGVRSGVEPVMVDDAECQAETGIGADLSSLPIPVLTEEDAGPYITMGFVVAQDPDTGRRNVSAHRMCLQGDDRLTIWIVPGRHLDTMHRKALAAGRPLPVSVNIGVDPATALASCCTGLLAPYGFDELAVAGALRSAPVELGRCVSVDAPCIANAEYVLEAEITGERAAENPRGAGAMPELLGYPGAARADLPVLRVKRITSRRDPIYQAVIGPGLEQSNLLGIALEAEILSFLGSHYGDLVVNAFASPAGGGQLLVALSVRKRGPDCDERVRRAAAELLKQKRMVKTVVLADEDVDIFDHGDLWWAMSTRLQASSDIITLNDQPGFRSDPTQNPAYGAGITAVGRTSKAVFDCTVPYRLRGRFKRPVWGPGPGSSRASA
jgi:UbiD family decarboxylase